MLAPRTLRLHARCGLKENVAKLPSIEGVARVVVVRGAESIEIPNKEGKRASVAVFSHLAQKHSGRLSAAAA
jgi:hypothetical protein